MLFIEILATVVFIEASTNVISKSDLFEPVRRWLFERNNRLLRFIHSIIDCPYCTSVWVSLFSISMLYLYINNSLPQILALFFMGVILHRLSNVLHFLIDVLDRFKSKEMDKVI